MDEAELESFRLWGGLLLLAKQHPGGSASWAVNEIERQQAEIERLEELLWQEAYNRIEIERLTEANGYTANALGKAKAEVAAAYKQGWDEAIAAERERCAQIVLRLIEDGDEAEECAAAIRKGE